VRPGSLVPAPRVERALVALAVQAQQLDDRIDAIERRLDALAEANVATPTHEDLLEVRLHAARVAAELARVTVELRAEIERAVKEVGAGPVSERERRIRAIAETVIDLSDRTDTLPTDVLDRHHARAG
jgi:hypothetical protein